MVTLQIHCLRQAVEERHRVYNQDETVYLQSNHFRSTLELKRRPFIYGAPPKSRIAKYFMGHSLGFDITDEIERLYRRSTITEDSIHQEVRDFDLFDPQYVNVNEVTWKTTMSVVGQMFRLKEKGRPLHLKDLMDVEEVSASLPWSHSPGLPYTDAGVHTKREAYDMDVDKLRSRLHNFKTGKTRLFELPPALVSVRNHLILADGPDKVRGVYAYPFDMWAIETMMCWDLIQRYKQEETAYAMQATPLIGGLNHITSNAYKYGNDFSKFDKTMPEWIIRQAFIILRQNIDLTKYRDWGVPDSTAMYRLMRLIEDYFINTPLVTPTGRAFQKKNGIPSGSMLTNLIGSICNALCTVYGLLRTNAAFNQKACKFFGDDSVIVFHRNAKPTDWNSEEFDDVIYDSFGLISNSNKSTESFGGTLEFLGYTVQDSNSLPRRDITPLLAGLMYPETRDRSVNDFFQRLIGMSYAGAFNRKFREACLRMEHTLRSTDQIDWVHFHFKKSISRMMRQLGVPILDKPTCCQEQDLYSLVRRVGILVI
ncbi:putative RNA-dependent RNA polymerase [Freshwater macrophyte associated partiti-like virus 1]|nr:putative RNA-dependent RNA polymerase [Freshwater macrophyte associated partiti-like virus 1]